MSRTILMLLFLMEFVSRVPAQTSEFGNYEIYSRRTSENSIGYLRTTFFRPVERGGVPQRFYQRGILYSHVYDIGEIGTISLGDAAQIRFSTQGAFRVGAGIGSSVGLYPWGEEQRDEYMATMDPFSLFLTPELTIVHNHGYSTTIRCAIGLISAGVSLAMPAKGTINGDAVGSVSLIPLSLEPSVYYDFGRAGLGAAFFFNPANLLEYRIAPRRLYLEKESGVKVGGATIKRYGIELMFAF
jgi:hypothetical protein